MKKLTLGVLVLITVSCSKEEAVEPQECNCGLITSDNAQDYSVTIRNNCSNNSKTFVLTPGDWMNAHVGENYCIYNITSW
jgi:hypothetical protein